MSKTWAEIVDAALAEGHAPNTVVYRTDLKNVRDMTEAQIRAVEKTTGSSRSADELFVDACMSLRAHGELPPRSKIRMSGVFPQKR